MSTLLMYSAASSLPICTVSIWTGPETTVALKHRLVFGGKDAHELIPVYQGELTAMIPEQVFPFFFVRGVFACHVTGAILILQGRVFIKRRWFIHGIPPSNDGVVTQPWG